MFGRSKPVVFEPHGYRRGRSWKIPRWLLILLAGIVIGVGGLLYAQEEYGPQRLTAAESQRLQATLDQTESERQRLQDELGATTRKLEAAVAEGKTLSEQLAESRGSVGALQQDIDLFLQALPPDPRGGPTQIRSARFFQDGGRLGYHVVVTRDKPTARPYTGVMQFVVAGTRGNSSAETNVTLDPIEVVLPAYVHLRGSMPLPEGFNPRETTVRVMDSVGGATRAMRVLYVR
ncbi:MAG: hypothetical protein M9951_05715 [Burkholderiaceae bacterium]|jgi:hypothetical protein|nr:hypothetical protein [Gemmatimonadales bacterium]MCO5119113.1 hypothetical protein [Burkholderiaceae bacterium]MEB2318504.1 hypothetical protein [Pseudomonadota bacterium]